MKNCMFIKKNQIKKRNMVVDIFRKGKIAANIPPHHSKDKKLFELIQVTGFMASHPRNMRK